MTDIQKLYAARGWVDAHSGRETWRVVEITPDGFRYDGPGFYAPQFKAWGDNYAETWLEYARRGARSAA